MYNCGMSIRGFIEKIKGVADNKDVIVVLIIVFVATASFGLGRLSKLDEGKEAIRIEQSAALVNFDKGSALNVNTEKPAIVSGKYVGSKSSDKYHFPWCSGAQRIKEENKIYFDSKEEAESSGYTPASNCKGL